uniref:Uncharacterized protein n=1 Tax=Tetranychus urticae TaxID=32264 RepID=T1K4P4_TETUR
MANDLKSAFDHLNRKITGIVFRVFLTDHDIIQLVDTVEISFIY